MPRTMEIFIKLIVGFPRDPKVRALARFGSPDAGLARDLYVQMLLHCKEGLTDGFVSAEEIGLLVYPATPEHGNQLAKQLASVELIKEESKNGAAGWNVLGYVKRNGTKTDVEALSKVRAEAGRTGGIRSRKRPGQGRSKASSKQSAYQDASNEYPRDRDRVRDIQTPTVSAGDGGSQLTDTQRSKRLTDAYAEAEPLCKWTAVNGVVLSAVKSGRFADDEIREALLRMAADNRSVTIDALRTELRGLPARRPRRGGASDPLTSEAYTEGGTQL